ncbi:Gfo/Idh/MocA family protein [Curtobacterium ammoniigenes]|uniref:Gfo/Idh/MocA family protein n=1 Tax=Curtobacterium ammoniigenes TaxID=395387 RepID=UPI000B247838|nr:Gfo/Idh/MocA family oxidoreductase [Curtobacterium ammoniigenes]
MADRTRYAIIGTGSRAGMYIGAMLGDHSDVAELVAMVDQNPGRMEYYRRLVAEQSPGLTPSTWSPDQLEQVIADERIDRVIVTTPDYTHAGFVSRALRAGADVVVEKPLTIDEAGSRLIADAVAETGRDVVMTFNYRYAPRNSAFKRVIASGQIGIPLSVHFEWVLDTSHGADYFRRWHRDKANSGGLLIHKASHHFDLVNWWIDDVPARVFASGGLRFYGPDNAHRDGRASNYDRGTDPSVRDPFALDLTADERLKALYLDNEAHDGYRRDQNVFAPGITIEDNLSLVVDYMSGASMSYSLNAHSPWEGYRIAVNGTEGRVELEVVERGEVLLDTDGHTVIDPSAVADTAQAEEIRPRGERILLQRHWHAPEEVPIETGEGGHGGGDAILLRDVFVGPSDDDLHRAATSIDGVRAIAVGIAGNRSLATGDAVRTTDLDLGVSLARGAAIGARS